MKRFGKVITALASVIALFGIASAASADHGTEGLDEHCPDHQQLEADGQKVTASGDPGSADETITVDGTEVQVVIDGPNVSFFDGDGNPIEVEFCMKASNHAGGIQTGSSGLVFWTNPGHQVPDISYVVVYSVVPDNGDNGDNGDGDNGDGDNGDDGVPPDDEVDDDDEPAPAVRVEPPFTG